jgi:hypothetical protein
MEYNDNKGSQGSITKQHSQANKEDPLSFDEKIKTTRLN